ncbi:DNA-binding protein [Pseudoduganella umbonata]|nr:DNA-binding protein [Pseudoduganella umbonata]
MARSGVYAWDVKRARDALIAKGRHPSIDAVRAELGDTGSKTTIHKYLRELEAEESTAGVPVSDAIQALVAQLAEQLKAEAESTVKAVRTEFSSERTQYQQQAAALTASLADSRRELVAMSQQLESAQCQLADVQQRLQQEQLARHTAELRTQDLIERLAVAERHQASLEEKHRHAREALDHFRTAAREQREQETRRHEHQVHSVQAELRQAQQAAAVKQEQLTQMNKEAAALAAELAANKQAIYLEKEVSRRLERKLEQLQAMEAHAATLESQAADARARTREAETLLTAAQETCSQLRQQNAGLEAQLTSLGQSRMLEQRINELQTAVFGTNKPNTFPESQGRDTTT